MSRASDHQIATGVAPAFGKVSRSYVLLTIATVLLLGAAHANASPSHKFPVQSVESACRNDAERHCRHANPLSASDEEWSPSAEETVQCLRRVSYSKLERECNSWLQAHSACEDSIRSRGACDLDRSSLRQCLRETHKELLPADCVNHDLYRNAVRSPVQRRRG